MIRFKGLAAKLIQSSASEIKRLAAGHKTSDLACQLVAPDLNPEKCMEERRQAGGKGRFAPEPVIH